MEKHAIVKGEVHISKTDRTLLFNRDLGNFHALYAEGRSDTIRIHKYTSNYFLYLIGYFTFEIIYVLIRHLQSALPSAGYDVEQMANDHGLEFEDEIDLEIHEIYESYDPRLRQWLLFILVLLFLFLLSSALANEAIQFRGITTDIPSWVLPVIMGIFTPFTYSGLLMGLNRGSDRDEKMATTINSLAESRNHNQILILVGDKHVNAVSNELKDLGWNVSSERSSHWLAQLQRLFPE